MESNKKLFPMETDGQALAQVREKRKKKKGICLTPFCRTTTPEGRNYCYKCRQRKYVENNPLRACYNNLKQNCKKRAERKGIAFDDFFKLTFEEFSQFAIETEYIINRGRKKLMYHIDRIDCRKGYEVGNIRSLEASKNCRKGNYEKFYPGISEIPETDELPF